VITEKSTRLAAQRKYVFEVHPDANKPLVREAVEKLFKVNVEDVNIVKVRGKTRRVGRQVVREPDRKKAIVTVREGQRIEIFEGV